MRVCLYSKKLFQVQLPYTLTTPFARFVALHIDSNYQLVLQLIYLKELRNVMMLFLF